MGNGGIYLSKLYRLCEWITRLAYVNLLWITFSLFGAILFGFSPATVAMFTLMRKWVQGETDIPVFKTFWTTYKTEFLKSNLLGGALLLIGLVLFIDLRFFQSGTTTFSLVFSYIAIFLFFLFLITLLFAYPVFVHYNLSILQIIKNAFFLSISNPLSLFLMIIGITTIYVVMMYIPGLIPFFGGSLLSYVLMWSALQSFRKLEKDLMDDRKSNVESDPIS
ncbi:YesL family protein [Bacillus solitudinis]|uniref:YesL family protein n=1 Tax=Bacillus solitudinis TaxID=2014074 RepID=UPI001D0D0D8F|nr:YesL family protein [Bacillus solitudinis]